MTWNPNINIIEKILELEKLRRVKKVVKVICKIFMISLNCSKENLGRYIYKLSAKEKDTMRKNIMKIGSMALAASMILTPVSSVFAADESQEMVAFEDGNTMETDTVSSLDVSDDIGNPVEELSDAGNEPSIEPAGLLTTAYVVTASSLNVRSGRGTNHPIIGSLSKGQTVYVYNGSLSDGWVKIKFAGNVGYVSAEYIAKK